MDAFHRAVAPSVEEKNPWSFFFCCGHLLIFVFVFWVIFMPRHVALISCSRTTNDLKGYEDWTPITRVVEGAETPIFKGFFGSWPDKDASSLFPRPPTAAIGRRPPSKFDIAAMRSRTEREKKSMPDDGSGNVTVWRIEKREKVLIDPALHGQFFSGDAYIVLYEYKDSRNKDAAIIYFWQGLKSSQDERADSALLATQLDDSMGVRLPMNVSAC